MTHNTTELGRRFEPEMLARERSAPSRPAGTKARVDDTLSGAGAAGVANIIRHFWNSIGFQVEVEIVPAGIPGAVPSYAVRSNLVSGLPLGPTSCIH
jgi:hypothetical protein